MCCYIQGKNLRHEAFAKFAHAQTTRVLTPFPPPWSLSSASLHVRRPRLAVCWRRSHGTAVRPFGRRLHLGWIRPSVVLARRQGIGGGRGWRLVSDQAEAAISEAVWHTAAANFAEALNYELQSE
jgi:hypothetical protein